ncbi:hypothetical protein [Streptomyces sp. NPDC056527]|uniref:hypothetical protein n=1 Tax=Streptomyces sp. NPDC056527 TaxID=3345853 RepID=UPI00369A69FB
MQRVRRTFLAVNAVPLAIGLVLSCATALGGVAVYGRLSLGLVWGFLQLGLFVASAWWFEDRSTRLSGSDERPLPSGPPAAGGSTASRASEAGW